MSVGCHWRLVLLKAPGSAHVLSFKRELAKASGLSGTKLPPSTKTGLMEILKRSFLTLKLRAIIIVSGPLMAPPCDPPSLSDIWHTLWEALSPHILEPTHSQGSKAHLYSGGL